MSHSGVIVPGYLLGFRYPVVLFKLANRMPNPSSLTSLGSALTGTLGPDLQRMLVVQKSVPELLVAIADQALATLDCGVMEPSRLLEPSQDEQQLLVPCHLCIAKPILYFLRLCLAVLDSTGSKDQHKKNLSQLISEGPRLMKKPFQTSNTSLFIRAAYDMQAPHYPREQDFVDYGLGKFRKRLQSSFTEQTSAIATQLAQDKKLAGDLLREALLPGSELSVIASEEHAVSVALELGFPIVLKPRSLDRGLGVYPNLQTVEEVRIAYRSIGPLTNQIVMERHFDGRDYRLVLYKNKVLWAIEREYPGVHANGVDTIRELVKTENENPLRGETPKKVLVPLQLDSEALACLRRQGLSADSIPESGRFVKLREKSNINVGGRPVTFPRDDIHPDNLKLAKDVAACIGLDLVGIDLLTSDLRVSWKASGALVCDINGQPTLGALTSGHLYREILEEELSNGLSPPIVIVAGSVSIDRLQLVGKSLVLPMNGLGLVAQRVAYFDGESLSDTLTTTFHAAQGLLQRKNLEALIISSDGDLYQTGLPHFLITAMVIPREYLELDETKRTRINRMLSVTLPHCQRLIISKALHQRNSMFIRTIQQLFPTLTISSSDSC